MFIEQICSIDITHVPRSVMLVKTKLNPGKDKLQTTSNIEKNKSYKK